MQPLTLIPIRKDALEKAGIPFSPYTLYAWRRNGKHKDIFVKISGKVFINAEAFWEKVKNQERK